MKATVVINRSLAQRSVLDVRGKKRKLSRYAPRTRLPTICSVNGRYISRAEWRYRRIHNGDIVQFHVLPQGGGGDSSKILRTVAIIAVLYFTAGTGATYNTAVFGSAATQGTAYLLQAGITIGALALVNAILPPPKLPSQDYRPGASASPTYNIAAQGNTARLGQAIPVQYGRHIAHPDFAAEPYAEFVGNEQYLYQLFCLGQGYHSIESLRLDDTVLSSYTDATYEIVEPGGAVTLFPTNVVNSAEVAGIEIAGATTKTAGASQTGTTLTITETGHGRLAGSTIVATIPLEWPDPYPESVSPPPFRETLSGTFTIATVVDADSYTITQTRVREGATGTATIVVPASAVGPYTATGAAVDANYIAIDVVCPRGLFYSNADGSFGAMTTRFTTEARELDDSGTPVGSWATLGTESITAATSTVQRRSYRYAVTAARYEVRFTRLDVQDTSGRAGHTLVWSGLRAYVPGTQGYGDVTVIALRLKATSELSQAASRKFNVISTRMLPIWNGTTWSTPTATRSIAWAIADACRNTVYGAKQADAHVDLDTLLELDAVWATRGDYFDARFDSTVSFWEAVQRIARAGRAKTYIQGGVVRVWRDQEQGSAVAMFTPRNTLPNSLSVNYIPATDETADAVEVEFFNADTWKPDYVVASLPDSLAEKPVKVQMFGVTDYDHAWREGMYMAACNRYRRRIVSRATELEGLIPSIGDLVLHADKRLSNAQSGEVIGWNAGTLTLTASEPLVWASGTHYVNLRRRNGSASGPYVATAGVAANEMVLAEAPDFTPYAGSREERTFYSFGNEVESRIRALVTSVRPRGETAELGFVAEYYDGNGLPYVHYADTGVPPAPLAAWQLPRIFAAPSTPTGLAVSETLVNLAGIIRTRMDVSWSFDANAEGYRVAWRQGTGDWNRLADTAATTVSVIDIPLGETEVRVIAFAGARETDPATTTVTILGKTAPPEDVTNFRINGDALTWDAVGDVDLAGYQLRFNYGADLFWLTATPLHSGLIVASPYVLTARPAGTATLLLKAIDTSGNESENAASIMLDLGDVDIRNILFSTDEHPTFSGTKTYCGVDAGVLKAGGLDRWFYPEEEGAFNPPYESAFGGGTYADATYEWTFAAPYGGTVLLDYTISAAGFNIEYKLGDQSQAFAPSGELAFAPTDEPFFGTIGDWAVWPGSLVISGGQNVYFRISLTGGNTQGQISALTSILDVPDVIENFNDVAVSPGGTRLAITRVYRVIQNVKLTLQSDGGTGVGVRIVDKDEALGPLVEVIDSSGTSVAGVLDATTQGY